MSSAVTAPAAICEIAASTVVEFIAIQFLLRTRTDLFNTLIALIFVKMDASAGNAPAYLHSECSVIAFILTGSGVHAENPTQN